MSIKIGDAIQRVQSVYSKGIQSDDTRLSSRHIYSRLIDTRAKLISQSANKNQEISQQCNQTLPCIEMIDTNYSECSQIPNLGYILKSKYPIPYIISSISKPLVQGNAVYSLDFQTKFDIWNWQDAKYLKGNKYTSQNAVAFLRDTSDGIHIFLTTKTKPAAVTITCVFEDPIQPELFPSYCNSINDLVNPCTPFQNYDFATDRDILEAIITTVTSELIPQFDKQLEDKNNNGEDVS